MSESQQEMMVWLERLLPGVAPEAIEVTPILGGRNNRAYKVLTKGKAYFLKYYNKDADAHRSRLCAEYDFLAYAMTCDSPYVTRPVACDESHSIGLYHYLEGKRFKKGEIGLPEVDAAIAFLKNINQHRVMLQARALSAASEACFSRAEHIQQIERRMERLTLIEVHDEMDKTAINFIRESLVPMWRQLKEKLLAEEGGKILTQEERVISPSDFGFHNALRQKDGRIKFVDFEYAGWDDPAKLAGDFFSQIEVPIPIEYFHYFSEKLSELVENKEAMLLRAQQLLPLYRIKWICIVLNYFLPKTGKGFVGEVTQEVKQEQLGKACRILELMRE